MDNTQDIILQSKNLEYIRNSFGKEPWVQVSGKKDLNGASAGFWCGLVAVKQIDEVFHDIGWDISSSIQGGPGFEGGSDGFHYQSNLMKTGYESVVIYRDFYGVKPDYIELSQEFILLNNLRYDSISKSYWAMYDSGESEEAVKYIDNATVSIKMKFLWKYAAAKQMAILLFFDIRTSFDGSLSDYGLAAFNHEYKDETLYYGFWGDNMYYPEKAYSVLMGKKIIMPAPVEECGFWPFDKTEKYEEFIIGVDEFGNEKTYTCNPDKLANYYGANPDAPMYLTPVFFKKEVLQKYVNNPELYEVRDGYLSCKSLWGMEIDNHHKNCISAYLGDLGRDLPECERLYWKSFNIVGEEPLSEISVKRDFLNLPAQSNMADHRFHVLYEDVSKQWEKRFGWRLFLPLSTEDQYNLSSLHIPFTNSQSEFDQLVLALVKTLIDSLNEKELIQNNTEDNLKGISKLERWLIANGAIDYEEHIQFLRDLQELRSSGTGHRKGKSYDKISKKFGMEEKQKMDVFEDILERSISFLSFLKESFLS